MIRTILKTWHALGNDWGSWQGESRAAAGYWTGSSGEVGVEKQYTKSGPVENL